MKAIPVCRKTSVCLIIFVQDCSLFTVIASISLYPGTPSQEKGEGGKPFIQDTKDVTLYCHIIHSVIFLTKSHT